MLWPTPNSADMFSRHQSSSSIVSPGALIAEVPSCQTDILASLISAVFHAEQADAWQDGPDLAACIVFLHQG